MPRGRRLTLALLPALLALLLATTLRAEPQTPAIAIIIDDLGNSLEQGEAVLRLPGPVTYAFLPFTPHAVPLALRVHRAGKQVMLHLPMDAGGNNRLGRYRL